MEQELGFCTTSDGTSIAYATVGDRDKLISLSDFQGRRAVGLIFGSYT